MASAGVGLVSEPSGRWLLITTRGNWKRLRERGHWVFKNISRAAEVREGDEALVYLTAEGGRHDSAIGGRVRFTGTLKQTDGTGAFDAFYPYHIPLEVIVTADDGLRFKPLREHVSFVSSGSNWGNALQGQPIKIIPREDYDWLAQQLGENLREVTE